MKRLLREVLPSGIWTGLSNAKGRVLDRIDRVRGRDAGLRPPRHLQFVGSGDFEQVGGLFLEYFIEFGCLEPQHRVLDIGCGIGRMAIPLTGYLSPRGSYEGVDIVRDGIEWCTENISDRFPNFRFTLADIRNEAYRADGQTAGSEYTFPFPDAEFDFVLLTSVFTHMLPADVENFLAEISRLLKPGGRCFTTWYLLNEESERLCRAGQAQPEFKHPIGDCLTADPDVPESAIAHRESRVMSWYRKFSLDKTLTVRYGSWCGRDSFLSQQDICVSAKHA